MNSKKVIEQEYFTFNDVLIVPKFSTIASRQNVDLSTSLGLLKLNLPLICANMDTVVSVEMCHSLAKRGAVGALHRFGMSPEQNGVFFKECVYKNIKPIGSIGITAKEFERAEALIAAGCEIICIDVANGAQMATVKLYDKLREKYQDNIGIIIGNFATGDSISAFKSHMSSNLRVDGFKVGIGGGCFAAGTRILMATGQYKNIEEVRAGDRVINKNGKPVNVVGFKRSGIKKVLKYRTNNFYGHSYATPDHQHWVGEHATSKETNNSSLVKTLDEVTKQDQPNYKWKRLDETKQTVMLLPNEIDFELPENFTLSFKDFSKNNSKFLEMNYSDTFSSSYDFGYILGNFLGDERVNNELSSNNGDLSWCFGLTEIDIAKKMSKSLESVFNIKPKITYGKNTIQVLATCVPLFDFFEAFGKGEKKELPSQYLCKNPMYLDGLFNGLIDSAGCYHKDGRTELTNTSKKVIELFMFVFKSIKGHYPSIIKKDSTGDELTNKKIENFEESYVAKSVNNDSYLTNKYQIVKCHEIEECSVEVETFDIEVDCETHSFIANNVIVHNSACLTRVKTGIGIPQLSAILDCVATGENIISDGGHKTAADVCKAMAAGAKSVMLGGMLAGTDESPGELVDKDGKKFKKYRGSASQESYQLQGKVSGWRTAEGDSFLVEYKGPVDDVISDIEGGLRSSLTYVDAKNFDEYFEKAQLVKVSASTVSENGAHGKKGK